MSFAEKLGSLMQRPNQDPVAKDDVAWWMKYAGRGLGTVGGGLAIFLGLWNCISILFANVSCLIGGMLQMVAGFSVIVIEAPCCCMFIDFVQNISDWVEKRPYWNRAAFYIGISIPGIVFCPSLGSFLGCGMIFGTGVIYGMMALGKKASAEEMKANASHLVDNAQPMSSSMPPRIPPV
uniref:Calcium channel flower n=1 Tax=Clastoptera arizonana TaxID=38151 RepID=A0A1B6CZ35_9HEMI